MPILGIDYGKKHIGLAIADDAVRIAHPLKEIGAGNAIEELRQICKEREVKKIIVGLPLSFRMEETAASGKVRSFGQNISRELGLPIEYENEVLTSEQVERELGPKADHSAVAALILQSWLERQL